MVRSGHVLTGELLRLRVLGLLRVELVGLDLHAVFQERHFAPVLAVLAPTFTEGFEEGLPRVIIPGLHVRRPGQVRIKAAGAPPDVRPEAVSVDLLRERLLQGGYRRLIAARVPGVIHAELYELFARHFDHAAGSGSDPDDVGRVVRVADCVHDPLARHDPQLVAAGGLCIRQQPRKHGAHEEVLDQQPLDELVAGLVRVRTVEQPRGRALPVSLPGVLAVPDVDLQRQLCHAGSEEGDHGVEVLLGRVQLPRRQSLDDRDLLRRDLNMKFVAPEKVPERLNYFRHSNAS